MFWLRIWFTCLQAFPNPWVRILQKTKPIKTADIPVEETYKEPDVSDVSKDQVQGRDEVATARELKGNTEQNLGSAATASNGSFAPAANLTSDGYAEHRRSGSVFSTLSSASTLDSSDEEVLDQAVATVRKECAKAHVGEEESSAGHQGSALSPALSLVKEQSDEGTQWAFKVLRHPDAASDAPDARGGMANARSAGNDEHRARSPVLTTTNTQNDTDETHGAAADARKAVRHSQGSWLTTLKPPGAGALARYAVYPFARQQGFHPIDRLMQRANWYSYIAFDSYVWMGIKDVIFAFRKKLRLRKRSKMFHGQGNLA